MRRGTTAPVTIEVDRDLTGTDIHVAFEAGVLIVKQTDELAISVDQGVTTIVAQLTQDDTLQMHPGKCRVQLRAFNSDGSSAMATDIGTIDVRAILEDGFLPPREA